VRRIRAALRLPLSVRGRALQLHPRQARLWMRAAAWEIDVNANISNARIMMQRGLRFNPDSRGAWPAAPPRRGTDMRACPTELWAAFFRMEIDYLCKLRRRRTVLGIADAGADDASKEAEFFRGAVPRAIHRAALVALERSKVEPEARLQFVLDCLQVRRVLARWTKGKLQLPRRPSRLQPTTLCSCSPSCALVRACVRACVRVRAPRCSHAHMRRGRDPIRRH
jgi:hypothetical protein